MMRLPLPQELAATFLGSPKLQNSARTAQVTRGDPRNLFTGCFEKKGPAASSSHLAGARASLRVNQQAGNDPISPCSHLIAWPK
jgi:hypothetical protein